MIGGLYRMVFTINAISRRERPVRQHLIHTDGHFIHRVASGLFNNPGGQHA